MDILQGRVEIGWLLWNRATLQTGWKTYTNRVLLSVNPLDFVKVLSAGRTSSLLTRHEFNRGYEELTIIARHDCANPLQVGIRDGKPIDTIYTAKENRTIEVYNLLGQAVIANQIGQDYIDCCSMYLKVQLRYIMEVVGEIPINMENRVLIHHKPWE